MAKDPASLTLVFAVLCSAIVGCGGNVVVDAKGVQSGTTSGTTGGSQGDGGNGAGGAAITTTTGSGGAGTGGTGTTSGSGAGGSNTSPPTAIAVNVPGGPNPYVALYFGTLAPSCSNPNGNNGYHSAAPMVCDGNWMVDFQVPLSVLYAGSHRSLKQDNCGFATFSGATPCTEMGQGSGNCQLDGSLDILAVDATSITFSFDGQSTHKGSLFSEQSGTFVATRCP